MAHRRNSRLRPAGEAAKAPAGSPAPVAEESQGLSIASLLSPVSTSSGKADRLVVNRTSKGSLLMDTPVVLQKRQKLGQAEQVRNRFVEAAASDV